MNTHKYLLRLFLIILSGGVLFLSHHAASGEENPPTKKIPDVQLNPLGMSPSAECGKCHKDIYKSWENSLHARATNNPVFWAAFLQAHFKNVEVANNSCLRCHAPAAKFLYDFKLEKPLTREGINCDFCHSISSLEPAGSPSPYRHEFDLVKQGPLKNVESPVHRTRYNPLFKQSRFCAGCHELTTPGGTPLIETFSEWQQGPYPAKGIHCQNCHMRKIPGKIVGEGIKQTPETEISSHDIAGGHSLSMRGASLKLEIKDIRINKQKMEVVLDLTNVGAGHKIPTGLPSKKLMLRVGVQTTDGETIRVKEKIYHKHIVDSRGNLIDNDADLMLGRDLKMIFDNRIGPMERRREHFTFFVPHPQDKRVFARVFYIHNPQIIQPMPIQIKMQEVTASPGQ
ncbi:MAG: multiheme c-type cytochrome [Nitrospinaceae bacterium]